MTATLLEVRPYRLLDASGVSRWQQLRDEPLEAGLSLPSNRGVLNACLSAITSVFGRLQKADDRDAVARNCGGFAETSAAIMPSSSYAWYIASLAAAQEADAKAFEQNWLQSARTGGSEQWIAGLRVALLEDYLNMASPALFDAEKGDLVVLVMSQTGIGSIARRYVTQPAFRERVVSVVEQMPEADQARFLTAVTRLADAAGAAR